MIVYVCICICMCSGACACANQERAGLGIDFSLSLPQQANAVCTKDLRKTFAELQLLKVDVCAYMCVST